MSVDDQIKKAVEILNGGGIIIFPTDTAFGIGCRIDNKDGIQKLFKIRKRPQTQAVPVLISGIDMARKYASELSEQTTSLLNKFWPGGLTVVVKANLSEVSSLVRGGGENIGLRMPDNDTTLKIISGIGVGLLGPSANFHGQQTPYQISELDKDLINLVDFVVEGECKTKLSSTVLDVTKNPWQILRKGVVDIDIS